MRNRKYGLRALGLSFLAALGLMAFVAASAQALVWDLNLKEITQEVEFDGNQKGVGLLLVPNQNIVIHCATGTISEGRLRLDNTAHATLEFSSCLTLQNGVNLKNCGDEVAGGINILPTKVKIKPVLHTTGGNGHIYLLASPLSGATFTSIHYGAGCALPLTNVGGTLLLECENGSLVHEDCKNDKKVHLIKPVGNQALLASPDGPDGLKYGLNDAILDGEAEVLLTGADKEQFFNALV